MSKVTIYKLDEQRRAVWQYSGKILERHKTWVRLEAYFDREAMDLGPAVLERGDRFVETFYSERWYNVFAVYGGESGKLKGWYCNVCRPAEIGDDAVRCEDLALDVWVSVNGDETTILDEDEFAALSLSRDEREHARVALDEILDLASQKCLPS